jgi:archaellum component FlaC
MSILKWSMESAWAAIAVVLTAGGSIYASVHHGGIIDQQIVDLQAHSAQTEAHVSKHDDQLDSIKQQNSGMQQSLNDIKDTVHDIQNQVRKRDNH